ncbi:hypothetical protein Tco_0759830 [Tanacetum coccineum]
MEEVSLLTTTKTHISKYKEDRMDKHGVPPTKRLFRVTKLDPIPEFICPWGRFGDLGQPILDNSTVPYGKTWVMVNGPDQRDFNLPDNIFNRELKRRT